MFNARDAVREREDEGPRRIWLSVARPEPGRLALSVRDNGVGIDQATRRRLFEPFFTTKPNDGGIGLGLATVRDVVQQHRGAVELETEAGRGTTFTVRLPAVDDQAEESSSTY